MIAVTLIVDILMDNNGYCADIPRKVFKFEYSGLKLTLDDLLDLIKRHNIKCKGVLCYYKFDHSYILDLVINENLLDSVNYGLYRINREAFYEHIYNLIDEGLKTF